MGTVSYFIRVILKPFVDGLMIAYLVSDLICRYDPSAQVPTWHDTFGLAVTAAFMLVSLWPPIGMTEKARA